MIKNSSTRLQHYVSSLSRYAGIPGIDIILDERKGSGVVDLRFDSDAGMWQTSDTTMLPKLAAMSMEEGTRSRSREEIRSSLEGLGSDLSIHLSSEYISGELRSTSRGFPESFTILGDILNNASFPETSVKTVQTRLANLCRENEENTRHEAFTRLTQLLYEKNSARYEEMAKEQAASLSMLSAADLHRYSEQIFKRPLRLVVIGDISSDALRKLIDATFGHTPRTNARNPIPTVKKHTPSKDHTHINGMENVDVFWGVPLDIGATHPDFVPLSFAFELLGGGGFTGHLMKTVRERDGLTYGVYARLRGVEGISPLSAGMWATFGNSLLDKGIAAVEGELGAWLLNGITEESVAKKKQELIGSHIVQLEDPRGLAMHLLEFLSSGRDLTGFAEYPESISALTVEDVRRIAERCIVPGAFSRSSAGSVAPPI